MSSSALLSIKTGGCTEDCGYCSQSVRHKTHVKPTKQLPVDEVIQCQRAKAAGSRASAWAPRGGTGNKKKAFREIWRWCRASTPKGWRCAT